MVTRSKSDDTSAGLPFGFNAQHLSSKPMAVAMVVVLSVAVGAESVYLRILISILFRGRGLLKIAFI